MICTTCVTGSRQRSLFKSIVGGVEGLGARLGIIVDPVSHNNYHMDQDMPQAVQ